MFGRHQQNAGPHRRQAARDGCCRTDWSPSWRHTHVQPTPRSIGAAEEKPGEVSAETVAAVRQAMLRARAADSAGDKNACEQALAEVQRAIGP